MGTGSSFGFLIGNVDELEDEGPASDDAAATGEEISTDDILKDGRLAGGLGAHHNLRIALSVAGRNSWSGQGVQILAHTI